jgi:hypothetical protein
MGVGTNHHTTREGVVLEDNLMDDTRARLPETKAILGGSGGQEVVDLPVDINGARKILDTANLGLNQVVTVDGGGDSGGVHTRRHELKQSHLKTLLEPENVIEQQCTYLSSSILARYSLIRICQLGVSKKLFKTHVRTELQVAGSSDDLLLVRVVEMAVHNLLGKGQWSLQPERR